MPASAGFLEMLSEMLAPVGPITIKRMFGGASVYADGVLFALVDDDVLYLKADGQSQSRFEAEGLGPFTYQGQTKVVAMSYWRVPDRLYDEPEAMLEWVGEAINIARAKPPKRSSSLKVEAKKRRSR